MGVEGGAEEFYIYMKVKYYQNVNTILEDFLYTYLGVCPSHSVIRCFGSETHGFYYLVHVCGCLVSGKGRDG